jgi:hypothetical protein
MRHHRRASPPSPSSGARPANLQSCTQACPARRAWTMHAASTSCWPGWTMPPLPARRRRCRRAIRCTPSPAARCSAADWRCRGRSTPPGVWTLDARAPAEADGYRPPERLAMLLPLSGEAARAAAPVRDGFLAGYYGENRRRPEISFYDTHRRGTGRRLPARGRRGQRLRGRAAQPRGRRRGIPQRPVDGTDAGAQPRPGRTPPAMPASRCRRRTKASPRRNTSCSAATVAR